MRSPVLTQRICLRACYAMPGTDTLGVHCSQLARSTGKPYLKLPLQTVTADCYFRRSSESGGRSSSNLPKSTRSSRCAAVYGGCAAIYGCCVAVYGGCAAVYGRNASIYGGTAAVFLLTEQSTSIPKAVPSGTELAYAATSSLSTSAQSSSSPRYPVFV
eukprot:1638404-Rhodomonas_salina.1